MANLFQPSLDRVTDSNGNPVSGAKMNFYLEGTTTRARWFTDQDGTVEGANPLVADSTGLFAAAYLDPDITYRVQLTNSTGSLVIWDIDNVRGYDQGMISIALAGASGAALIGTESGGTVQEALNANAVDISNISSDLSSVAVANEPYGGASPLDVLATYSTANIANPDIADVGAGTDNAPAIGTTTANQLHRLRNNATGLLSAQSPTALGSFAVTRKYDVVAGGQYTFHVHNTAPGWHIYSAAAAVSRLQFFNTDGSFHSEITSGFTAVPSGAPRQVTFTVPVGAGKVAFNMRNSDAFSNTSPMTESSYQALIDNSMLQAGASATPFTPYTTDAFAMTEARFEAGVEGSIKVTLQDEFAYIKSACQQSDTKDIIWRFRFDHGVNYFRVDSRSGVIDIWGARFVAKDNDGALPSLFNLSAEVHCAGVDESCPEKRNQMFVDGGHGSTCYKVTKDAHGMANADVGSIWSDGTDQWILLYVESTSILVFQRRYTGTNTKWSIASAAPGSATFTHVSGATTTGNIAFTSPTQAQFVPIVSEYTTRLVVDGTKVTADGDYAGNEVWIEEGYIGLNLAKVQDALIAGVGTATPNWTPDVPQVRRYNRYEFDKFGGWTLYGAHYTVEEYNRATALDYFGGIQLQRLSLTGDSTGGMHAKAKLYIPDVGTVGSYNFKTIADVTANAAQVDVAKTDCDVPADPSSMFCLLGTNGSNAILSGQAFGYEPTTGIAVPAVRTGKVSRVFYLSSAEKNYPTLIDWGAGDAVADEVFEFDAYRSPFLPTDADLTIPGVVYYSRGRVRCIIAAHKALSAKEVRVPREFSGRAVTILRGAGMTLDNGFVRDGIITVSVAGSHGWAVLALG